MTRYLLDDGTRNLTSKLVWNAVSQPTAQSAKGIIYFDSTVNKLKASENGGTFVNLLGSGTAGNVGGSGTTGEVAFWISSSTISHSAALFWDNTNSRLGVQTNTPDRPLDVNGDTRLRQDLLVDGKITLGTAASHLELNSASKIKLNGGQVEAGASFMKEGTSAGGYMLIPRIQYSSGSQVADDTAGTLMTMPHTTGGGPGTTAPQKWIKCTIDGDSTTYWFPVWS